jgi:four helix bundle protein
MAKWQRMWDGQDNQEVGLEAAILERKRNSSLVEQLSCAEDVAGLKPCTEAAGVRRQMTEGSGQQERASAFEDLAVFRRAYALSLAVHRKSLDFPAIEQRGLADQVRRASKSICANLAEGWGRRGFAPADFRRFVVMAVGSADEMRVCGPATVSISAILTRRRGVCGATSTRRSRECFRACVRRWRDREDR